MRLYEITVKARKDGDQGIGKNETFNLVAENEEELKKVLLAALKVCKLEYLSGWSVRELDIEKMTRKLAMDLLKQVQVFNSPRSCRASCQNGQKVLAMFTPFNWVELEKMREEDRTFDKWCNMFFEVEHNLKRIAWPHTSLFNNSGKGKI